MEILLSRNKLKDFVFQCLCLTSPEARVVVFGIGMFVLFALDLTKTGLPDLCLWERLLGYCPPDGTTRALNALLRGNLLLAVEYNKNILLTTPIIVGILLKDLIKIYKRITACQKIKSERGC